MCFLGLFISFVSKLYQYLHLLWIIQNAHRRGKGLISSGMAALHCARIKHRVYRLQSTVIISTTADSRVHTHIIL